MRRLLRALGGVAALVFASAGAAAAHPLGNFTVNHLSRITIARDAVTVRYVLDLAEIPAFALDRSLDERGAPPHAVRDAWARKHAAEIAPLLELTIDERRVALLPAAATIEARPGAGGLPTLRATVTYSGALPPGAHALAFADRTEPGRLGWKDVVIGTEREATDELRIYPSALLGSPRSITTLAAAIDAHGILIRTGTPAGETNASMQTPLGRSNALSDVLQRGATDPLVVLGALLLAIALGALHALEPGHGKTLLAVSLVGARATPRQAIVLAAALTVAHTAGVLVLGLLILSATQWIVPEQIYPWITLGSGLLIAVIGARAVAREVRRRLPFAHAHDHAHPRAHMHAHDHVHAPGDHHHLAISSGAPLTFRSAVVAAASGNVAPCPAALVVLLAAINLHHVGYGLVLIVAFSLGLAALLTILGIAVVRGAAWLVARPRFEVVARFAPLVTASVIALVGAVMVAQGLAAAGIGSSVPLVAVLIALAIAGYAFAWHGSHRLGAAHA
ncbi:MAG: putative nickel transporter [Candidatus Eremiobacteraeota bacterium]|nr:putative nickel transporter [Candidatus Eremiobacteraeota bacterium]